MLTTLHAPAQPTNAYSACWARDVATRSTWGFLTSGHAVSGLAAGDAVPLAGGQSGTLEISGHPPIDAAFVSAAAPKGPKPHSLRAFSAINFPAAGLPVEVVTASRVEQRHAVAVQNSMGVINTSYYGIQVFFDQPCLPGDSVRSYAPRRATRLRFTAANREAASIMASPIRRLVLASTSGRRSTRSARAPGYRGG